MALAASRHLDVAGPADPGDLGDHRRRVGDVLEHVRADDVVEHAVGEGHVGGVGVEQRAGDPRRGAPGALPAVLGVDVAVEQHVGPPVRLVAAADVEHEGVGTDRDGDAAAVERPKPASQLRHRLGIMADRTRSVSGWQDVAAVPEEQPVVAAFDVDGTLTTRDCVVPFLRHVAGTAAGCRLAAA